MAHERNSQILFRVLAFVSILLLPGAEYFFPSSSSEVPLILRYTAFTGIIPLFVGLWFGKSLSLEFKLLLTLIAMAVVVEAISVVLSAHKWNNYWPFNIYTLFEFGLLMLIFALWQNRPKWRYFIAFSVPAFVVVWVLVKVINPERDPRFDSYAATFESVVLVAVSVLTLIRLTSEDIMGIFRNPRFWVVSAVMIYFSGNLIIFALANVILSGDYSELDLIWSIHSMLGVTANLIYAYSFYSEHRRWTLSH